jgi:hypothetical protein
MSIFPISDKLSLESTGGISLSAIPASLTQLNSMTMVSVSNSITEEDLQAIFEANYVSTDNTDTAISETEHSTDTETETDATMSEMDNITDTNTDTDFVFFVKESACTCWPDRALFRARLMSIFAISDKLSLESTGGISLPAIPASLTQLNSMTMVSVSNSRFLDKEHKNKINCSL